MTRILAATPATVSQRWSDQNGDPVDPGAVTVAATRDNGDTQTIAAIVVTETGLSTVALTGAEVGDDPDWLSLVWTSEDAGVRTQQVDVVGGWIVDLADMRALLPAQNFTPEKLRQARDWFEDLAEHHCGVAFRPRYSRTTFLGRGDYRVVLPALELREIVWATIDGADATLDDWYAESYGRVTADTTFTYAKTVTIGYRHGLDAPPAELVDVGSLAVADAAKNDTRRANRVLSVADPLGNVQRDSVASTKYPTGIPAVDSVLNRLKGQYGG